MNTLRRTVPTAARLFLGLVFTVFGLNFFLHFLKMPPPPAKALAAMGGLFGTGYLMQLTHVVELVGGVLLLSGLFVPLALALLAPVIVNILAFHLFLAPPAWSSRWRFWPRRSCWLGPTARRSRRCCTPARRCRPSRKRASRRASCTRLPDARHFLRVRSKTFWSFGLPPSKDVQVSRM